MPADRWPTIQVIRSRCTLNFGTSSTEQRRMNPRDGVAVDPVAVGLEVGALPRGAGDPEHRRVPKPGGREQPD